MFTIQKIYIKQNMFINLFAETISIRATKHCETLTETNIVCVSIFFSYCKPFQAYKQTI
jgi:hypothetical protein